MLKLQRYGMRKIGRIKGIIRITSIQAEFAFRRIPSIHQITAKLRPVLVAFDLAGGGAEIDAMQPASKPGDN